MARAQSASDRLALRKIYLPDSAQCVLEHENGSALYTYEHMPGRFAVVSFWGTSGKSLDNSVYRSAEARDKAILAFKGNVEAHVAYRAKLAAERKATANTLKAGDIINTSWGYDQTNVDFYVVTRVSGTRVYLRRIASDYEATGYMCGRAWPKMPIEMVGPEFWAVARGHACSIDGHSASLTTGDTYTSSYA